MFSLIVRSAWVWFLVAIGVGLALAIGGILNHQGEKEILLWTGILGTAFMGLSMLYSLRKRFCKNWGSLKTWLRVHEILAVAGPLCIFVHMGLRYHALVPLITLALMILVAISGLTGRYIHMYAKKTLAAKKTQLLKEGLSPEDVEERIMLLVLSEYLVRAWKMVHLPINAAFLTFLTLHVVSSLLYGGWR